MLWVNKENISRGKQKNHLQGEHAEILSTFIKLPFAIRTFVLCIFEWPLKTGYTVH